MLLAATALGACGDSQTQTTGAPTGTYQVSLQAAFPHRQAYAVNQTFQLRVQNESDTQIPNVTATVDGFTERSTQADMSDPQQPVWIVNTGPVDGVTALVNTWALGPVPAHGAKTFVWHVTPMQSGIHRVHYRVNASLYGTAKAVDASGGAPEGHVTVRVSPAASKTAVDPETGDVVVTGAYPQQ